MNRGRAADLEALVRGYKLPKYPWSLEFEVKL
jgi:hypothetical protein